VNISNTEEKLSKIETENVLYERFHRNGQLGVRGNLIDGEFDGLFEWFDVDGNLTSTETYRNGDLI